MAVSKTSAPADPTAATPISQSSPPDDLAQRLSTCTAWAEHQGVTSTEIDWIQTHISHVFLVGDRVFKLRKAVRLPFLDFTSREERNADCVREVALNRRLAPDVYLGIAPILLDMGLESGGGSPRVGAIADGLSDPDREHVVVMRRLPKNRDALTLLENGQLDAGQLETVAERLADFHASHALSQPAPWSADAWLRRIADPIFESLASIAGSELLPPQQTKSLESRIQLRLGALRSRFETRRLEGRAVDAHGDLHLDHVWFETKDAAPLMIDCLEFNEDLRLIDAASEVAFLQMDLCYRNRQPLAEAFLAAYALRTDDYGLYPVVDFYAAYRALVRAKVAAVASAQPSIGNRQRAKARVSAEKHVALAKRLLDEPGSADLVVLCGSVGSGKSTVARSLGRSGAGVPIASDRVRKALAQIPLTAHEIVETDTGLYDPENTESVYRALLGRAERVVSSGRSAVLDASFARRIHRDRARQWAAERGLRSRLIEVRCRPETALARLKKRSALGTDPSDAGPDFLSTSLARFETPTEWPADEHEVVWTD
jgi:aminoglycoside phosphotransferase family enzyme/predicted kinase